jgi:hypothetical protein
LSQIPCVTMQHRIGKKDRQTKIKLVKALVDTDASKSVMTLVKSKGLPLRNNTETKNRSTHMDRRTPKEFRRCQTSDWTRSVNRLSGLSRSVPSSHRRMKKQIGAVMSRNGNRQHFVLEK